jgi:hypothetical protein
MGRALKYLFRLAVLAVLGIAAYALLADLPPPTRNVEVELPVPEGTGAPPPEPAAEDAPAAGPAPTAGPAPADEPPGVMQE